MNEKSVKTSKKPRTIDMIYVGLSAALIALGAWIAIPVGDIPITLQTLMICLVSGLFGMKRGTLSVIIYVILGAVGMPVFSNFKAGLGVLAGPTGGYIVGFVFTALIVGFVSDKMNGKLWAIAVSMVVGIAVCYLFGTAWFYVYMQSKKAVTLSYILGLCVVPYIVPDVVKIAVSCVLVNRLKKFVK